MNLVPNIWLPTTPVYNCSTPTHHESLHDTRATMEAYRQIKKIGEGAFGKVGCSFPVPRTLCLKKRNKGSLSRKHNLTSGSVDRQGLHRHPQPATFNKLPRGLLPMPLPAPPCLLLRSAGGEAHTPSRGKVGPGGCSTLA